MKSGWHVACASSRLIYGKPLPIEIAGERIVLFRDTQLRPQALKDRCCHRGLPLSLGRQDGDRMVCGFHGWEYAGSGSCVRIPSQLDEQKIPKTFCVPQYRCQENDHFIWLNLDWEDLSPCPSIPEIHKGAWIQGSRLIGCAAIRALEITFDSSHLYHVHPTHPATVAAKKFGFAMGQAELRMSDTGCRFILPATEGEALPENGFMMEFSLPGRISFYMLTPQGPFGYMFFYVTPTSDRSCHMHWVLSDLKQGPEGVHWRESGEIIDEDQVVLEKIQRAYSEEGEAFERSVEADLAPLTVRRIYAAAEKGLWNPESQEFPKRRRAGILGPARFEM